MNSKKRTNSIYDRKVRRKCLPRVSGEMLGRQAAKSALSQQQLCSCKGQGAYAESCGLRMRAELVVVRLPGPAWNAENGETLKYMLHKLLRRYENIIKYLTLLWRNYYLKQHILRMKKPFLERNLGRTSWKKYKDLNGKLTKRVVKRRCKILSGRPADETIWKSVNNSLLKKKTSMR